MRTTSDAKRRANDRWNARHMQSVTTSIRREEAEAFKLACDKNGTTRSAVLHQCIKDYIREYGGKD